MKTRTWNTPATFALGIGFGIAIAIGCGDTSTSSATVSQIIGPEGGYLEITKDANPDIAGTTLFIPPNAIPKPTLISLSKAADIVQPTQTAVGPAVRIAPDGLLLMKGATLTLPFTAAKQPMGSVIAINVASGMNRGAIAGDAVTIDRTAGTVKADVNHFSDYQAVAGYNLTSKCTLDADCPMGQKCITGTCGTIVIGDMASGDGGTDGGSDASMSCFFDTDCTKPQRCVNGFCQ